jgi:DNA modification methylase
LTPYYQDAAVKLFHGDCRDILPTLEAVDHVITDPPYEAEAHTLQRRVKREGGVMEVEALEFPPMDPVTREAVSAALVGATKRWLLVFCQVEGAPLWRASMEAAGASYRRTCIWVKPDGMPQYTGDRPGMVYEAMLAMHAKGRSRWNGGGRHGVWIVNKNDGAGKNQHPTQKPEPLLNDLIATFTDAGETILDPFGGSGTTAVAAKRLGRRCILIEKEEKYCEVAAKRLAQGALDLFGEATA